MKKVFLPVLLLHITMMVNAATYYFSSTSGDDSRTAAQATNSTTPWKTIGKLNSIMSTLLPGDSVLFKRGDVFAGGLVVSASGNSTKPIVFGAYGSGNKPVISGFTTLSGWSQARPNVWEAPLTVASAKEGMVVMNNQQQAIGRYPNSNTTNRGYLNIDANNGFTQITSKALSASPFNWTGGDVVIRKRRWMIDRSTITSQSGNTLNFAGAYNTNILNKYGFFIVNHTNTLDMDGEWYYDKNRNKLQMYFSGNNPASYTVKASTIETLVSISFQNYINFSNLAFEGGNSYAFNIINSGTIHLANCSINFTGINAIQALSSDYFRLDNSTISNTNNDGINFYWNCNNTVFANDTIRNTALIPGMGQSDYGTHQGLIVNGNYNLVTYCEVDSTGANGIHFEGDWSTVKNSYVNTFGLTVDDCGGIYTGQGLGDSTIRHSKSILDNIVVNGIGATAGTDDTTYVPAVGIYFDDNTNHVTALRNTAANCAQTGIFNHNTTYSDIENNTFYNNGAEQFLAVRQINPVSKVVAKNNIFFSKTASQLVSRMESYYGTNNLPQIGDINNNYYCRPVDNNYMFYDMYEIGNTGQFVTSYETLDSWKSKFGIDKKSATSPGTFPSFTATNATGVNIYPNGGYTTNVWNVAKWSPVGDETINWLPNQLDGGTLQLSANNYSSSNYFYTTLPTNVAVMAGTGCLLSFTVQGAAAGRPLTVYLKQQDAPNKPMTQANIVPIPGSRSDYQFAFVPTISGRVSIELDIAQPNGAVWIDNVMLQQATITPTNPDDYIVFQYNPGKTVKTFTLNDTYMDAKGVTYSGTVSLQPYTSVVLFKQSAQSLMQSAKATQAISLQGNLVSASAASLTSTTAAKLNWKVDNQNSTASYYEVERSSDAKNFTTLGKATVKTEDASVVYQYEDASPLAGKNYYRITQHNSKGDVVISKTVAINNISFKVNPNPAKDVIHVSFDELITASDKLDKEIQIRNAAGVTVQTVRLSSTDNLSRADINVASLQKGMYVLSVTSEGQTFNKAFLKL